MASPRWELYRRRSIHLTIHKPQKPKSGRRQQATKRSRRATAGRRGIAGRQLRAAQQADSTRSSSAQAHCYILLFWRRVSPLLTHEQDRTSMACSFTGRQFSRCITSANQHNQGKLQKMQLHCAGMSSSFMGGSLAGLTGASQRQGVAGAAHERSAATILTFFSPMQPRKLLRGLPQLAHTTPGCRDDAC